jgi:type IV secretion system protein VirB3
VEDEDRLTEDPLFLALTRPTLMLGVPLEAAFFIILFGCLVLIIGRNPIYAMAIAASLLGAARFIVRSDYNMFRVLALYGQTKGGAPNRQFWGGSTYSPLPVIGYKRRGFTGGKS